MKIPSRGDLRMLPSGVYAVKVLYTKGRSVAWLVRTGGESPNVGLRMLFYHRVTADRDPLGVSPGRFRAQMEHLAREGWRATDLVEAAGQLTHGGPPDRLIGLSFDDGYADVIEHAMPVLEELGFSATVFVVPGLLDGDVTFDWYDEVPRMMSWDDVTRLDGDSPLRFEAHSVTHPNLLTLDDDAARREIAGSKEALEAKLGRPVEAFAYPAGLFGAREIGLVKEAGFKIAVSTEPGLNNTSTNPFALRRTQVERGDSLLDFRAKLGSGHDALLPLRALHRRLRYGASPGIF